MCAQENKGQHNDAAELEGAAQTPLFVLFVLFVG
jgi:hypothetical protein